MLNHNATTASIAVTGLALGCYDRVERRWEVGFIDEPEHTLTLQIIRHSPGGDVPVATPPIRFGPRNSINIRATDAVAPPDPPFYTPGGNDPEDFNRILDIERDVYGNKRIDLQRPSTHGVIPLFVSDALLYSVAGSDSKFRVKLIVKGDPKEKPVKRFGYLSTAAGADLTCRPGGSVLVSVTGPGGFEVDPLPHTPGTKYIILLDNTCPRDFSNFDTRSPDAAPDSVPGITKLSATGQRAKPHSDFVHYYTVLDPRGKGFFDLRKDEASRGDGAVCNYSHLGVSPSLFPLP